MDGPHPRSTARIGGHPIHPMLVPIPIVCFIGALVTDVVYCANGVVTWTWASNWLLGIGLGGAGLAAAAGLTDFLGDERLRGLSDAVKHMLANVAAVAVSAVNLALRLTNGDPHFVATTGVFLSGAVVLILIYSGWKGGELVYRYGVGVRDEAAHMPLGRSPGPGGGIIG
jgi:uncharacterized membrane protein